MRVLVQKERNSRWLNLAVVLILVAMIAIDLAIYFRPDGGSGEEEARVARAIESCQKEQAKLAQQFAWRRRRPKRTPIGFWGKSTVSRRKRTGRWESWPSRWTGRKRSWIGRRPNRPSGLRGWRSNLTRRSASWLLRTVE